jgi:hypothetical protein
LTPAILNSTVDKMYQLADKQIDASDRLKAELRARELAVADQERELAEKLLRIAYEASKRAEEARAQLRMELAAERAEFKREMAAERAEFKREMAAERAELRQDRVQFMKERDELKTENSALKRELEIRLKQ